jgi:uroporphyrinogen decarboxylase
MTGEEILFKAIRNELTPRPAWVPFVGVHGAHLIGAKAENYLKSVDLMFRGLTSAAERYQADGIPVVLELTRQLKASIGDKVGLYGLICGPFTLALHLMGQDLFMKMFDHPDYVKAVVSYCASVGCQMSKAYIEAGCDEEVRRSEYSDNLY